MDSTSIKQSPAVKTNSLRAWILAARPKTLTGAVAPVLVGMAFGFILLFADGGWTKGIMPAVICILFAFVMQVDANFINDYFDWKKGADSEERLGPERACSQGWITPRAMKKGIVITTVLSILIGLPLVYYGGWWMLVVGIICIIDAFLYTTKLSYWGLGDIMVVLFFGIVPVFFTFHVIADSNFLSILSSIIRKNGALDIASGISLYYDKTVLLAGLCVGLVVNNLLIVNNYRDRELDGKNRKKTLVVRLGARAAEWIYLLNGIVAIAGVMITCKRLMELGWPSISPTFPYHLALPLLFLPFLFSTHRKMVRINHGRELNNVLGETARNILIYSLLFVATIIVTAFAFWYSR
ncbi:MAG: 1,4-dihydroxy-2-naphthoate octaprenyltransferase [Bacteroidales bacterium]|jgi:1,4-dihydroxy-2-naphthoate octaprenyltransferase|nr:1,4-dihydroxy-2-naphthoate octaprenyltransferase [Bacteroidales bacterium]